MLKLNSLKEWLSLEDAAKCLAVTFGDEVEQADVLRLALDGHLRLSVNFVNNAKAKCGYVVSWEETDWELQLGSGEGEGLPLSNSGEPGAKRQCPKNLEALIRDLSEQDRRRIAYVNLRSLDIDGERYVTLSNHVITLRGVWDLPMIGSERLDVEHKYQMLTGGPAVTLTCWEGAFVEGRDGQVCQLQDSLSDCDYESELLASVSVLEQVFDSSDTASGGADFLTQINNEAKRKVLKKIDRKYPESLQYYPAVALPEDAVIVVRTQALRDFEQRIRNNQNEQGKLAAAGSSRDHVSEKLALMNRAAMIKWSNADRNDRGTHPTNANVAAWLIEHGFSHTLADKAATIIRPEWAPTGRKPEE